jgi:hypothetical protein
LTLSCADPDCGCKITYAPKSKSNGTTYHYYRCADGRRVHAGRNEPQVNVREGEILEQLGTAVDAITLTPEIADAIADGLNASHQEGVVDKARAAQKYRAEIEALKEKQDSSSTATTVAKSTGTPTTGSERASAPTRPTASRSSATPTRRPTPGTSSPPSASWNSPRMRKRFGNGGAMRRSAISSRGWFVTRAWRVEPCVMTYKSTSPRWPRCAAKGDGVPKGKLRAVHTTNRTEFAGSRSTSISWRSSDQEP